MKYFKIFISIIFLFYIGIKYSFAEDCSKLEKLSKEYAKCNAEIIKNKTSSKIEEGKKKFFKLNIREKILKFKKSKSFKDFVEN